MNTENIATAHHPALRLFWTNDHREWYRNVYLKSSHWRVLRTSKLKANPACQRCGSTNELDVHHRCYRNLFDVTFEDLETLCRKCHKQEHLENGMPVRSKAPLRQDEREARNLANNYGVTQRDQERRRKTLKEVNRKIAAITKIILSLPANHPQHQALDAAIKRRMAQAVQIQAIMSRKHNKAIAAFRGYAAAPCQSRYCE